MIVKNLVEIILDGYYYLDRNFLIFYYILDYYFEGYFYILRNICFIYVWSEVEFWGIFLIDVLLCCYEILYGDNEFEFKVISVFEEEINEVEEKYN